MSDAEDPVELVKALVTVAEEMELGYVTLDTVNVRAVLERLEDTEQELRWSRKDYQGACNTIAAMHHAAVGEIVGPNRGVVEDVADLRERCLAAEEALAIALAQLRSVKDSRPCGRSATHPPHKWMSNRRAVQCLGVGEYEQEG